MRRAVLITFTVIVVGILFIVLCTYVRRPYEKVLLRRFGNLISEQGQTRICYNWYLKWPTDSVERFDTRLHLYPGSLKEVPTAGSDIISVRAFAAWRVVDAEAFYKTTGGSDDRAQQMIDQIMQGQVAAKVARYHLDELFNSDEKKIKIHEIEASIARDATEDVKNADGSTTYGLRSMGIQMAQVGFSRMAFAPSTAGSVYSRMVAELNKKAQAYQADGVAQANIILAEGRATADKERQEGLQMAAQIRGQGDAEANRKLAEVLTTPESREFYEYVKNLEYAKASLTKNTVLILPSDSVLIQNLFRSPRPPAGAATRPTP